ncbi:AAA family ATPase [Aquabacterium sp. A7-Y]|uniref:ATPase domain-containing protein n=1 Tax=Aquabacterium sp. A7-Y TaxID=1349605 RepID=UPI00223D8E06|nr:ATPase domain-containing protein [Aquabacterium sp. A7-Y]MCW7538454.1 AAA family ATPase [Aquabacterium sp. A7-Y]
MHDTHAPTLATPPAFISSGIPELDLILGGGITPNRLYMIEGIPGSGKTTLGLQFLQAGARAGESVLYITLSETEEEVRAIANSHHWDLEGVQILQVVPDEQALLPSEQYTVFQPDEVELGEATKSLLSEVERRKPARVVFDSLSELRLLAGSPLRYRRQMLGLKQFFAGRQCTVFVLDDRTATAEDPQLQSIAHGIVALEQWYPAYGRERRRLRVVKYRGVPFIGGYHDFTIRPGGMVVFPRLVAAGLRRAAAEGSLRSGVAGLDELLGGGLERGTSTLVAGAPGTGKSTIATCFAAAAAAAGERAAMFLFDESLATLLKRMRGLGCDLQPHIDSGRLTVRQIDPAELSPGEFAHLVACTSRDEGASVVVIDSLNGYLNAMPDEKFLNAQLHEMLTYLGQMGTTTLLVGVQQGLIGNMSSPVDASYLADTVVLMRYFEAEGMVRQAVSVLKKRSGLHERAIREFSLDAAGIRVSEPLRGFHGVLTGVPTYIGSDDPLVKERSR